MVTFEFLAVLASHPSAPMFFWITTKKSVRFGMACMRRIGWRRHEEEAYHEAGHCVAAIAQGLAVQCVSLRPDHAAGAPRAILSAADNADAQVAALKTDIIVLLAGVCAQEKLRPAKRQEVSDDYKLAQAWASWATFIASVMSIAEFDIDGKIELSEEEQVFADRLLNECEESAHRIVAERWADIVKVADALLDHTILDGDKITEILARKPS